MLIYQTILSNTLCQMDMSGVKAMYIMQFVRS